MSKRAFAIMANVAKESPAPSGPVPGWFSRAVDNSCTTINNGSEPPPSKKRKVCRSLKFPTPRKEKKKNSSVFVDAAPNQSTVLGVNVVDNGGASHCPTTDMNDANQDNVSQFVRNQMEIDENQNESIIPPVFESIIPPVFEKAKDTQDTDGDFLQVLVIKDIPTSTTSSSLPLQTIDEYFAEVDANEIPEVEHDDHPEMSEIEQRAPSTVLDQSRNILDEEAEAEQDNGEQDLTAVPQGLVTPNNSGTESSVDAPKKPSRKRVACPAQWKGNMRKAALNSGKSHTSSVGKERKARELGEGCTEKCNRCKRRLTLEEREEIRKTFWAIGSHQRQLDYVLSHTKSSTPQKKFAEPGKAGVQTIRTYFFQINGKHLRVCKKTFMATLVICDSWVKTSTNHSRGESGVAPKDMRGKHKKSTVSQVSVDLKNSVREHINLIPKVESHYTRSKSKREYVENGLSIEELYRRYVVWVGSKNLSKIATDRIYRKIFNEEFNIGFFKPKKDQCVVCARWKHALTQDKAKMAREYALHTENRNISQRLKESDKKNAEKEENINKLCVASFDMQKILTCPKSEVSEFYYKSKLNLYNFTIFDMAPRLGVCYMWNETEGRKGSSEVASGVFHFIERKQREGIKEFVFYSDNPTSQNKNRYVFAMYLLASTKFSVKITHRFLEVGHTHMEVDSMHAAIEKSVNKKEIFSIEEWYSHILDAKKNGKNKNDPAVKYSIEKVGQTYEILNFRPLVEKQNWELDTTKKKIQWMKIKEIHCDPQKPGIVSLKYEYNFSPIELNVNSKKGRPVNLTTYSPGKAYDAKFPLTENKIKDLKDLMRTEAIPSKYHEFYKSLLNIGIASSEDSNRCPNDCVDCEDKEDETQGGLEETADKSSE